MQYSQLLSQTSWHTFAQQNILKAKDRIRIGLPCSTPTHHYRLCSYTGCEIYRYNNAKKNKHSEKVLLSILIPTHH